MAERQTATQVAIQSLTTQVAELKTEMTKGFAKIDDKLSALNGCSHSQDKRLAVLEERQKGDTDNWSKVWDVLKPALVAVITGVVVKGLP